MEQLSQSERMVLFALSAFSGMRDREIAERIGLKNSTFTATKNRLKKMGYFKKVRKPAFHKLDYEIFSATYGNLSRPVDMGYRERADGSIYSELAMAHGRCFYMGLEYQQYLMFSFDKNFNLVMSQNYDFRKRYMKLGLLGNQDVEQALLPLEGMYVYNMFNATPLLYHLFGFSDEDEFGSNLSKKELKPLFPTWNRITVESPSLTSLELRTLYALCKFPTMGDNRIAKMVGAARQTIARVKKNLMRNGFIETLIVPDLKKIGYDIVVFAHTYLRPDVDFVKRKDVIATLLEKYQPYLFMTQGNENVMLVPFESYGRYKRARNELYQLYKEMNFIEREPIVLEFALENMHVFREHGYYYCL